MNNIYDAYDMQKEYCQRAQQRSAKVRQVDEVMQTTRKDWKGPIMRTMDFIITNFRPEFPEMPTSMDTQERVTSS